MKKKRYKGHTLNWKVRKGRQDPWQRKVKTGVLRKKDFKNPIVSFVF